MADDSSSSTQQNHNYKNNDTWGLKGDGDKNPGYLNQHPKPRNIGIIAMDIYFPNTFVSQEKLEIYDKVPPGKYTIGLGQSRMAFCNDREDIGSICLTVVESLMRKYNIPYESIGRLEVGTETLIDKSKSVKSILMQLFAKSNNYNIEGVDSKNACYGGTAALFNSIAWMESSMWDGRLALMVTADIAVYGQGPARPTGGAAAIAILIGPNAPIVFDTNFRTTFMDHQYDFFKPNGSSEYPIVDGPFSNHCYLKALSHCYTDFRNKSDVDMQRKFSLDDFDYLLFHAPYSKIVQKALTRLCFLDYLDGRYGKLIPELDKHLANSKLADDFYQSANIDRDTDVLINSVFRNDFLAKASSSLLCAREIGNMYCASLYACLLSLICTIPYKDLLNKRIGLFSFGSGLASSFYSLRIVGPVDHIKAAVGLDEKLQNRIEYSPEKFIEVLMTREKCHLSSNYIPSGSVDHFASKTYFLDSVDDKFRRFYKQTGDPKADATKISN